jgi:hypothetical protein
MIFQNYAPLNRFLKLKKYFLTVQRYFLKPKNFFRIGVYKNFYLKNYFFFKFFDHNSNTFSIHYMQSIRKKKTNARMCIERYLEFHHLCMRICVSNTHFVEKKSKFFCLLI